MDIKKSLAYLLAVFIVVFLANFVSVKITGNSVFYPIKSIFFQSGTLGPSAGTTYYLDAVSGSDLNDGLSQTSPWKTLSKAQSSVSDGDTVLLFSGNYGQFLETISSQRTNWITWKALSGQKPVFDGISVTCQSSNCDAYLRFDEITVTVPSGPFNPSLAGADFLGVNFIEILNSKINSTQLYRTSEAVKFSSKAGGALAHDFLIKNSDISNAVSGIRFAGYNISIISNQIHKMPGSPIGALSGTNSYNVLISNNHIYDHQGDYPSEPYWSYYDEPAELHSSIVSIRGYNFNISGNNIHDINDSVGIQLYCPEGTVTYLNKNINIEKNLIYDVANVLSICRQGGQVNITSNTIISNRQDPSWNQNLDACKRFINPSMGAFSKEVIALDPKQKAIVKDNVLILGYTNSPNPNISLENNFIYNPWSSGYSNTNKLLCKDINLAKLPKNYIDNSLFVKPNFTFAHGLDCKGKASCDFSPKFSSPLCSASGSGEFIGATPCENFKLLKNVTQYGITWYFDKAYPVGQFVNGDYWVLGPVNITSVSPGFDGTRHGTMINPNNTLQQGYDTRAYSFNDSLRTRFPVVVKGNSSVISTIGLTNCNSGGASECLSDAAVLTVVSSPKSRSTFRPSYFGDTKKYYSTSQVDYSLLPSLSAGTAQVPNLKNALIRPWLDHGPNVYGAQIHPKNNMPPYPRDSSTQVSQMAALVLTDIPEKKDYANRLIQLGIDLYPIAKLNAGNWRAQGGFGSGRKFPILFAGTLLHDAPMKSLPYRLDAKSVNGNLGDYTFGEDGHTYYGQPTADFPEGKPLWGANCSAYGAKSPWFVNHDCRDPKGILEPKKMTNGGTYRICCTSYSWVGSALAAEVLNLENIWAHPAFFDYVDRWTNEPESWAYNSSDFYIDYYGYGGDGGGFMRYMWETYHKPECNDGKDNDGDGFIDYPNDLDCSNKDDNVEAGNKGGNSPGGTSSSGGGGGGGGGSGPEEINLSSANYKIRIYTGKRIDAILDGKRYELKIKTATKKSVVVEVLGLKKIFEVPDAKQSLVDLDGKGGPDMKVTASLQKGYYLTFSKAKKSVAKENPNNETNKTEKKEKKEAPKEMPASFEPSRAGFWILLVGVVLMLAVGWWVFGKRMEKEQKAKTKTIQKP